MTASGAAGNELDLRVSIQSLSSPQPVASVQLPLETADGTEETVNTYVFSFAKKYRIVLNFDMPRGSPPFLGYLDLKVTLSSVSGDTATKVDKQDEAKALMCHVETLVETDAESDEVPDLKTYMHLNDFNGCPVRLESGQLTVLTRIWPCLWAGSKRRTRQEDYENVEYVFTLRSHSGGASSSSSSSSSSAATARHPLALDGDPTNSPAVSGSTTVNVSIVPKSSYYKWKQKRGKPGGKSKAKQPPATAKEAVLGRSATASSSAASGSKRSSGARGRRKTYATDEDSDFDMSEHDDSAAGAGAGAGAATRAPTPPTAPSRSRSTSRGRAQQIRRALAAQSDSGDDAVMATENGDAGAEAPAEPAPKGRKRKQPSVSLPHGTTSPAPHAHSPSGSPRSMPGSVSPRRMENSNHDERFNAGSGPATAAGSVPLLPGMLPLQLQMLQVPMMMPQVNGGAGVMLPVLVQPGQSPPQALSPSHMQSMLAAASAASASAGSASSSSAMPQMPAVPAAGQPIIDINGMLRALSDAGMGSVINTQSMMLAAALQTALDRTLTSNSANNAANGGGSGSGASGSNSPAFMIPNARSPMTGPLLSPASPSSPHQRPVSPMALQLPSASSSPAPSSPQREKTAFVRPDPQQLAAQAASMQPHFMMRPVSPLPIPMQLGLGSTGVGMLPNLPRPPGGRAPPVADSLQTLSTYPQIQFPATSIADAQRALFAKHKMALAKNSPPAAGSSAAGVPLAPEAAAAAGNDSDSSDRPAKMARVA